MRSFFLLMLGIWLSHSADAQHYFNKRETLHSTSVILKSVLQRGDRLYSASYGVDSINHASGGMFWSILGIRFSVWDGKGKLLYDSSYQRPDSGGIELANSSLIQLPDGTFLIGASGGDTKGHLKHFLFCFDSTATLLWHREYDKPIDTGLRQDFWQLKDLKPDGYGNWLMLSTAKCAPLGSLITQMMLTKLDSSFNIIWCKRYGFDYNNSIAGQMIVEPHGYTLAGGVTNDNRVMRGFTYQTELFRTDTAGNQTWVWHSDQTKLALRPADIIRTKDGGYVYCGMGDGIEEPSASGVWGIMYWRTWIERIDSNGKILWNTNLGNELSSAVSKAEQSTLMELEDGSIIIAGQVLGKFDKADSFGTRNYGSLTRLDPHGQILWQRRYVAQDSLLHFVHDMKPTGDEGYILVGETLDKAYPYEMPKQRAWMIKVDSNGCLGPGDPQCMPVSVLKAPKSAEDDFTVYPNPANAQLYISLNSRAASGKVDLHIRRITGQTVLQMNFGAGGLREKQVDISHIVPGIYFAELSCNGVTARKRIVIQ